MDFLSQFKAARRVSTPIIAVRTTDPTATMQAIKGASNGSPLFVWDIVRGLSALNQEGSEYLSVLVQDKDPSMFQNPTETLSLASNLPQNAILFMLNGHRFLTGQGNESVIQGVWNLRDKFKANGRTLVILCSDIQLPAEISQDVLILDEPLPTEEELAQIIKNVYTFANLESPTNDVLNASVEAVSGLAAFSAEQAAAMSLTKQGMNISILWERKRQQIEQTPGLSVWRGGETFGDISGLDNIKTFLSRVIHGKARPRAIVFIDEIEKAISGISGDLSGVSQEMLGTLLSFMQDTNAKGIIAVGPPGSGKSLIAKAVGNEANIPTISFDLSGMKGSLVGESGANLRNALKVVTAVSQGATLFFATCNSIGALPPELRRRFSFGTFFFDLPTEEERVVAWKLYRTKFAITTPIPPDNGWTAAEIKICCELAWGLDTSLEDASKYIVPVSQSASEQIEILRRMAAGRFISASHPGVYRANKKEEMTPPKRDINWNLN